MWIEPLFMAKASKKLVESGGMDMRIEMISYVLLVCVILTLFGAGWAVVLAIWQCIDETKGFTECIAEIWLQIRNGVMGLL